MAFLPVEQLDSRVSSAPGVKVDFVRDWPSAASRLSGGRRSAFQHGYWLSAWYEAFTDVAPLIAVISSAATGKDIAVVPMISHLRQGIRMVEFADLGVSDINAPILACGDAFDATDMRRIAVALVEALRALPDRFDLLRLKKMPAIVGSQPNPLVALGRLGSCSLNGNLVLTGDDYAQYQSSIKRMQMPRCWRVFGRQAGARFEIATDISRALEFLDAMDVQQQERMQRLGSRFVLNDEAHARFYRDVASQGVANGYAVVAALVCDEAIVATTLGVNYDGTYYLLRIGHAGGQWANCSPGLLVTERTMAALHARGIRRFDLSIGNHDYKRRFGAEPVALTDVSIALSWRGLAHQLRDRVAQGLRRYPRLAGLAARAIGKPH